MGQFVLRGTRCQLFLVAAIAAGLLGATTASAQIPMPSAWYSFDDTTQDGWIPEMTGNGAQLDVVQYNSRFFGDTTETFYWGDGAHVNASNSLGPAPEHYVTGAPFPGSGMAYHMAGGFHTEYNDDDNNGTFRAGGPNPESTAGTYNISTSYRDNLRMGDPDGDGNFNGGPDRTHPTVESVGGVLYRSFWMQLTEPVAKADRITGNSDLDESGSDYAFVIHNDGEGAGDQGNYTGQIAVTHSRQGTAPPPGDNGWFTYPYVLSLRANDPTGSSDKIVNVEAAPFVVGDWHHFVVGYEPNKTKVWFDGNLVMDDATLGTYDPGKGRNEEIEGELRMNNVAWSFAAKKESGDFLIDDLAFFQEPLTDAHVQAIYTQGVAGAIPEPGTALMALVGLVGLLGLSRRRRDG